MNSEFETVIGLEVHVQLKTRSKIFCGCSTEFGALPNTNTCAVCLGYPGSLPVLNYQAYLYGIRIGLALSCKIAERLKFDRKNYFYPDLPKAYQISQYDKPICHDGYLVIDTDEGEKRIGITRAHMEEDAGKLLHEAREGSVVDFNRAGVPLVEIVSEPDLRNPEDAYQYLTTLKSILQYIEVSDCDMEKGSLRCDANVSVRPKGESKFGTKVEIKNLNSFNAVKKAIYYEIERQVEAIRNKEKIRQETRLWNDDKGVTIAMRSKEEAHDYRYFPEPDLVPFTVSRELVDEITGAMVELPRARKQRFTKDYGLSEYDARVLTQDKKLANYFEESLKAGASPKLVSNWLQSEMLARMYKRNETIDSIKVAALDTGGLVKLIETKVISGKIAKDVYDEMLETGKKSETIVKEKNLVQVTDESAILKAAEAVLSANPKSVEDYKKGKTNSLTHLMGQIMKETQGKANPAVANKVLKELLEKV